MNVCARHHTVVVLKVTFLNGPENSVWSGYFTVYVGRVASSVHIHLTPNTVSMGEVLQVSQHVTKMWTLAGAEAIAIYTKPNRAQEQLVQTPKLDVSVTKATISR